MAISVTVQHASTIAPSLKDGLRRRYGIASKPASSWVSRLRRLAPVTGLAMELVRFDMQAMENPESGRGISAWYAIRVRVREYLLAKWEHACAYCGATEIPLNLDHIVPRARGGSNRVQPRLRLHPCNEEKARVRSRNSLLSVRRSGSRQGAGEAPAERRRRRQFYSLGALSGVARHRLAGRSGAAAGRNGTGPDSASRRRMLLMRPASARSKRSRVGQFRRSRSRRLAAAHISARAWTPTASRADTSLGRNAFAASRPGTWCALQCRPARKPEFT